MADQKKSIEVRGLECRYEETVILKDISFSVSCGEIFVVVGPSGCGKSTLLKNMIGLHEPARGEIRYFGRDFCATTPRVRQKLWREMGILYQSSALWSAMTVAENVALPLQEYTRLPRQRIAELVSLKLALVGLDGFENRFPAELSGGMKKRAGLARALALDPKILFFDEPSAGLDPLTSRNLDQLILKVRASLGTTVVVVSHELDSIFAIADRVMMLDAAEKGAIAIGPPEQLREEEGDPRVREFLTRGGELVH
jgi:phospholipid/cholesterol/gamma-HCH transport system ATP-binding protein